MEKPKYEATINLGQVGTMATIVVLAFTIYGFAYKSLQDGEEARAKYIPIIEKLVETQSSLNNRQENQGEAILQMRQIQNKTSDSLSQIAIDMAIVKTIISNEAKMPSESK